MGYSKAKYIEKFGEDAWLKHLESERERNKSQFQKHKEKRQAKHKEYRESHREECNGYCKKYRDAHKDELSTRNKLYHERHRDEILVRKREKYRENQEHEIERRRVYLSSFEGRAVSMAQWYSKHDKDKNRDKATLTKDWIIENIFNSKCVYCGDSDWMHLGADRIDNSQPHTPENCVCACSICNIERQWRKMSVSEFVEYRKNHPRFVDLKPEVVEVSGVKVLRKRY